MKRLFLMECRKITRSVLYWLYLAALVVTVMQNYETTVENELGQTDNPASVFYIAENGVYAENTDPLGGRYRAQDDDGSHKAAYGELQKQQLRILSLWICEAKKAVRKGTGSSAFVSERADRS